MSAQVGMDVVHQLGRDGTDVVQSEVSVGCPTYYYQRIIITIRQGSPESRRELREEANLGLYTMALTARATWRIKEDSLAKSTR